MLRKMIAVLLFGFIGLTTLNAEGFKNTKTEYFYKVPSQVVVEDWTPPISDNFYVSKSYESGSWTRITDTLSWGNIRPSSRTITFLPDTILNGVTLAVFVNPNDGWLVLPSSTFTTNFVQSVGTVTSVPDTIFNNGTYSFTTKFITSQLPSTIQLQYSFDGVTWLNKEVLTTQAELKYSFTNTFISSNVIFRYVYVGTKIVIAQTSVIPFKARETYFKFTTYGGIKTINDYVDLKWEKSENFTNTSIKVLVDNKELSKSVYFSNILSLNFTQYGTWTVIGVAESPGFRLTDTVSFYVGDPCTQYIQEIATKNKLIDSLKLVVKTDLTKLDSLKGIILEKNSKIEYLTKFIKDSSKIQLIYKTGDITEVKDDKYSSQVGNLVVKDGYIFIPELLQNNSTYWIFTLDGKLIKSDITPSVIKIDVLNYQPGTYFLYILHEGKYSLYKFIK